MEPVTKVIADGWVVIEAVGPTMMVLADRCKALTVVFGGVGREAS